MPCCALDLCLFENDGPPTLSKHPAGIGVLLEDFHPQRGEVLHHQADSGALLYRDHIGVVEKKMEASTFFWCICWGEIQFAC